MGSWYDVVVWKGALVVCGDGTDNDHDVGCGTWKARGMMVCNVIIKHMTCCCTFGRAYRSAMKGIGVITCRCTFVRQVNRYRCPHGREMLSVAVGYGPVVLGVVS